MLSFVEYETDEQTQSWTQPGVISFIILPRYNYIQKHDSYSIESDASMFCRPDCDIYAHDA